MCASVSYTSVSAMRFPIQAHGPLPSGKGCPHEMSPACRSEKGVNDVVRDGKYGLSA